MQTYNDPVAQGAKQKPIVEGSHSTESTPPKESKKSVCCGKVYLGMGKKTDSGQTAQVQIPLLPLTFCVTMNK